ncbi:MAG: glycerophosphodiester phosphodiesterase [Actinobacteria bacterium]|nr:glycerophosphodiester phosphodiesterase [Actinomycetota bacterium]
MGVSPGWLEGDLPIAHAHRGGSAERAENSVEAFENAVGLGYRYVETDVRRTRDDRAVIWHDATLDRTTDRTGRVDAVAWHELRRAGLRPPGDDLDAHRPLLLEDLLGSWPELRVTVDAKEDAVVGPLTEAIRRCRAEHRVCVASFSTRRLRTIRRTLGPHLCTATTPPEVTRIRLASVGIPLRRPVGPNAALVPIRHLGVPVVDRRFVRHARRWGLGVHVWTVDDPATMQELLDVGVAGIMTDRPSVLRGLLEGRGMWPGP